MVVLPTKLKIEIIRLVITSSDNSQKTKPEFFVEDNSGFNILNSKGQLAEKLGQL